MKAKYGPDSIIALVAAVREQANLFILDGLSRHGVSDLLPTHGSVLNVLFQESPIAMSALAKAIGRKKNTVTSLINTLEERGYCRRETDCQDARVQLVALTDKGKGIRQIQAEVSAALLNQVWKGSAEEERDSCIRSLSRVLENLKTDAAD